MARLVAGANSSGLFFDFDGVLGPIQVDPATVWPTPGVVDALSGLVARVKRVAIVSARPIAFLRPRFDGISGLVLYGHYGLQTMTPDGTEVTDPAAVDWMPVIRDLADRARAELPDDVLIEQKPLSVTLHYRAAPHRQGLVRDWGDEQVRRLGVAAQSGRMIVEIRPPVERDKGHVIERETGDLETAWYFGDDVSDLRAFQALSEREAESPGFVGVRVAVTNEETGQPLAEAADIRIETTAAVPRFLGQLLGALERGVTTT